MPREEHSAENLQDLSLIEDKKRNSGVYRAEAKKKPHCMADPNIISH